VSEQLSNKLAGYLAAITSDGISIALGSPPTAIFGQTFADGFSTFLKSRADNAKQILIEEFRSGERLDSDVNPETFYGLLFQYLNAVKIGAARRNLRLIAQIVREGSTSNIPFQPDELASCAKVVSDLTRDEIILLAELKKQRARFVTEEGDSDFTRIGISDATADALVPQPFLTKDELFAIASAIQRTGLITLPSVWGGNRIQTTKLFDTVCRLCEFEGATKS
jgi:hypothetical protein